MAKPDKKTQRRCSECGHIKPLGAFLPMRAGWKTTICNPCAQANMAVYWKSRDAMAPRDGFNPADHFKSDADAP